MVIIEFSVSAYKGPGGIAVPRYGGDFAVPKDGDLDSYRQIAEIIKNETPKRIKDPHV